MPKEEEVVELFLEVFSEEIPAKLQRFAASEILKIASIYFKELGFESLEIASECAVRRLVLFIKNLPKSLPEFHKEIRGPRTSAPSAAINGFMSKYSISNIDQLTIKGEFYFYECIIPARSTVDVCAEVVMKLLNSFTWPKSMRWGSSGTHTWIRPIHSIICMLGTKVLDVEYAGVKSSNFSFGHRALCDNAKFEVSSYADYLKKLQEYDVILGFEERKEIVEKYIDKVSRTEKIQYIEDTALMEEVLSLSENPYPMLGSIEERFMKLPFEVLVSTIKSHQKYLMFTSEHHSKAESTDSTHRNLSKFFMIVADGKYSADGAVKHGNERVLTARLSDAEFFYLNDLKKGLSSGLEKLKNRVFHSDIGSMHDKVERMCKLCLEITPYFGIECEIVKSAVMLCKCDLASEMVFEFPELQGIMGYYYAIAEKIERDIAIAIRDHYKPQGPNDSLPSNKLGAVVAITDKLDSLIELFKIDVKPTGNKDPFAQRRAAIGILRILDRYDVDLPLEKFIEDKSLISFIDERKKGFANIA